MAVLFGAAWFGVFAALVRVAEPPGRFAREAPAEVVWRPEGRGMPDGAGGGDVGDARTQWTPAAFALPTPAGFSHELRRGRSRLAPPTSAAAAEPVYLDAPEREPAAAAAEPLRLGAREGEGRRPGGGSVFPPRAAAQESAGMEFPEGWEPRLFSGIDLDYGGWTSEAWSARVEVEFDARGVAGSALVAQSSGIEEVDRRLARNVRSWRLLEDSAPRRGVVVWRSPAGTGGEGAAKAGGGGT